MRVLLDREVPDEPGMGAVGLQYCFLDGRGKQAVTRHTNTLATVSDISREVTRRLLPDPKGGVSKPRC